MISVEPAIEKFHLPPSLVKWRMSSRGQEEGRGGALTAVASVTSGSTVISTFILPATVSRMLSDRASYNWKHTEVLYHINLQGLYCEYFWCHCTKFEHPVPSLKIYFVIFDVHAHVHGLAFQFGRCLALVLFLPSGWVLGLTSSGISIV